MRVTLVSLLPVRVGAYGRLRRDPGGGKMGAVEVAAATRPVRDCAGATTGTIVHLTCGPIMDANRGRKGQPLSSTIGRPRPAATNSE